VDALQLAELLQRDALEVVQPEQGEVARGQALDRVAHDPAERFAIVDLDEVDLRVGVRQQPLQLSFVLRLLLHALHVDGAADRDDAHERLERRLPLVLEDLPRWRDQEPLADHLLQLVRVQPLEAPHPAGDQRQHRGLQLGQRRAVAGGARPRQQQLAGPRPLRRALARQQEGGEALLVEAHGGELCARGDQGLPEGGLGQVVVGTCSA
jgi:hypothetical protein